MRQIPVFAGLGSDALFGETARQQALRDARSPQGQVLMKACHRTFVKEVSLSVKTDGLLGIGLDDFQRPSNLIQPCERYHRHPVVQHATLCIAQLLRYQQRNQNALLDNAQVAHAASGFCAGLFTALVVATAQSSLEYLSRAEECFRAAVMIGIASERSRRKIKSTSPQEPWSLVVDGIDEEEMAKLLSAYLPNQDLSVPVYISAVNAKTCVTVSGEGKALRKFAETELPARCRLKATNLYSLYHDRCGLGEYRDRLLRDFEARHLPFPTHEDLRIPLISTIDGSLINHANGNRSMELLRRVLDMTLLSSTDWVAVQDTLLSFADEGTAKDDETVQVYNYGPGYGALKARKNLPPTVTVTDVSLEPEEDTASSGSDIAIVGMGIDLPGAPDSEALWQLLMDGINTCSEIPSQRFHVEDYYNKDGNKSINQKRSLGTKYGNFLENPFLFDSQLFGISPREAPSIDPQQRLMLQTVYRSLENAGYVPDSTPSFSRETFGCFVGSATLDYVDNLRNSIDVYYSPGTLRAFLSGRISHAFNWSGPSLTVDTACSSSLVAIYQAVRAIIVGDCRAAVAGGVNVVTSPDMYLGLDRAHFLSPTGQCKAFDQSADGYCRSEGCAAYVLKRLDDAVAENDRILGVIKGVDINQSGQSSSITHPHSPTQEKLFERLLSKTRANLQDVSVVEAHGTGTPSGDPSEVRSIRNAFCKSRSPENPLHMTSIKANIGHCEAASGGASLAKLLLMLKHGRMPPQPSLTKLNPAIDPLGEDGAVISSEASDWPAVRGTSRIALLNNFGAAGSNAALLLQEHQAIAQEPPEADSKITWCFGVSARDEATLKQMQQELTDYLTAQRNELSVADVCYTSTARRSLNQFRLSTSAWSIEQLITNLKEAASYEAPSAEPPNVFLFSGQGSQYFGMGRQLMGWLPQFTKTVQDCHQLLVEWGLPSCMDVIQPSETAQLDPQNPTMLQALQSGIYVLEVALSHLLTDLGMQPNMVAGHSLGEYAALVTAGVLDIESGLWLVAHRARLIVASCELWETSMLAVKMAADQVGQKFLSKSRFEQLSISCDNSQNDCVVGGDKRSLQELKDEITSRTNQRAAFLQVPIAYHTAALDPVLEDLKNVADQVSFTAPRIPVASNVLRRVVQPGEDVFTPEYFAEHCRSTVAFNDSMLDVLKYNEELANGRWVEVGPHPTLLPMVKSRTSSTSTQHLSCMTKDQHPSSTLANVFTAVYRNSKNVHWRKLFESTASKPNMINLPTMPFHRKEYYVPLPRENRPAPGSPSQCTLEGTQFSLLDHVVKAAGPQGIAFETSIRTLESLIKGHMVCEKALCPASIYGELALAGISHREGAEAKHQVHKLSELSFSRPLIFLDGHNDIVKTNFGARHGTDEGCPFEISSRSENEEDSQARVHCSGKIKSQSWSKAINKLKVTERALSRRKLTFLGGDRQSFSTNVMYKKIFSRVVEYSSLYQAVHKIYIDEDAAEIFASCELPPSNDHAHYAGNPVLLDTILHVAGFAANLNVENDAVCICHEVHSIRMLRQHIGSQHAFEVHCSNFSEPDDPDSVLADAYAMDDEGIVAVIKGMRFQRAKLSKVKAGFDFATRGRSKVGRQPSPAVKQDVLRPEEHPTHVETDTEQPTNNEDQASTAASIAPSQATLLGILSETTGVNSKDIIPRTELDAIGVDSLMAFELEDKLQKAIEQPVKSSELTEAKTVGDLEKIVTAAASKAGTPISKGSTPPRSVPSGVLRDGPRSRTDHLEPADIPRSEPTAAKAPATGSWDAEPTVSKESIELLRNRLKLDQQPEHVQEQPAGSGDTGSGSAPLYLIHPGAGMCHEYYRIGSLGRAVYAIHDPRIFSDLEDDWSSIEDMADAYADIIRHKLQTTHGGGLILGGYSFGALIAFEMARRLSGCGSREVHGVVLIDAPPPIGHTPLTKETIDAAMTSKHSHSSRPRPQSVINFEKAIGNLACRNNIRRAALLRHYKPEREGKMPKVVLLRSSKGFKTDGQNLPPNEWLHDRSDIKTSVGAWEELLGHEIPVIDIPGDHFTPFQAENIGATTQAVWKAIDELET